MYVYVCVRVYMCVCVYVCVCVCLCVCVCVYIYYVIHFLWSDSYNMKMKNNNLMLVEVEFILGSITDNRWLLGTQ